MNADDLHDLYKMLRGSRSALMVLDARGLFMDRQYEKALALLVESRDAFAESRTRLMKQDAEAEGAKTKGKDKAKNKEAERAARRIKRKQDKVKEILDTFDELVPQVEKLAKRRADRQPTEKVDAAPEAAEPSEAAESNAESIGQSGGGSGRQVLDLPRTSSIPARPSEVTREFSEAFRASSGDQQLGVISQFFGFCEVQSESDIHADALYYIRSGEKSFLIRTLADASVAGEITMATAIDSKPMKPFKPKAFLKLGKKRKMVLLTSRSRTDAGDAAAEYDTQYDTDFDTDFDL